MLKKTIKSMLFILVIFSSFLVVFAQDSEEIIKEENDNIITIEVIINETEYAGAELSFSIEDEDELKPLKDKDGVVEFKLNDGLNASFTGFTKKDGKYFFGFYSSENIFDGETYVGDLKFEYTGNKDNKIVFDEVLIARINEDKKAEGEYVEYPTEEYIIKRAGNDEDDGGGNGGGHSSGNKKDEDTPPVTHTVMEPTRSAGTQVAAVKTNNPLILDDEETEFPAVNIDDYNWLKLRDIAMLFMGTSKQFSLSYDPETGIIDITTGGSYEPLGDELEDMLTEPITAIASPQQIRLNGQVINIAAYNVAGYNYFRLRDIAILLDFAVNYDDETRVITLDLAEPYTE